MRIGELARATGTNSKKLRFYDATGLLPTAGRTPAGYRDYGPEALDQLAFIRRGQAAGLTLAQIKEVMDVRATGVAPCTHVEQLLRTRLDALDEQISGLLALRSTVAELHVAASSCEPASCEANTVCRYI